MRKSCDFRLDLRSEDHGKHNAILQASDEESRLLNRPRYRRAIVVEFRGQRQMRALASGGIENFDGVANTRLVAPLARNAPNQIFPGGTPSCLRLSHLKA